jgi:hypothetical protein
MSVTESWQIRGKSLFAESKLPNSVGAPGFEPGTSWSRKSVRPRVSAKQGQFAWFESHEVYRTTQGSYNLPTVARVPDGRTVHINNNTCRTPTGRRESARSPIEMPVVLPRDYLLCVLLQKRRTVSFILRSEIYGIKARRHRVHRKPETLWDPVCNS